MIQLLVDNPLILLFVVASIGSLLGRVKIGGVSLGVAAVLFVGLAFGALDERLKLPDIIYTIGLALFVYTIGLSSGPSFFASLRRKGLRDNIFVVLMILFAAALSALAHSILSLSAPLTAGLFAGSLTNTPALAAVLEQLKRSAVAPLSDAILAEPVVGYSVAYPMGVLGMILTIYILQRIWKPNYAAEAHGLRDLGLGSENLVSQTIRVTKPDHLNSTIAQLISSTGWDIIFGRIQHDGQLGVVMSTTRIQLDDLVTIVGCSEEVEKATAALGERIPEHLGLDRHMLDYRRMVVSNPLIAGKPLHSLDLPARYGAVITRVRRGDSDLLPNGNTVLAYGDRVRVVARRDDINAISDYFGDSYRALAEIDIVSLGLGLAFGLLLGMVPIPLPGGMSFQLGIAGGPLIVSLILGWRERTGPIVWSLPYSANLTLRQFGLTLFLAGVGTRSGHSFINTFAQGGGVAIFLAGTVITCLTTLVMLLIGYRLLKIPMGILIGMVAGLQTQPAVLAFTSEQTKNDLPNIGYATVYPMAIISKILIAQLLLNLLM